MQEMIPMNQRLAYVGLFGLLACCILAFLILVNPEVPDPATIAEQIGSASKIEIKVAKDAGGFYDTVTLLDTAKIEQLVRHITFDGRARSRRSGTLSTTAAADIVATQQDGAIVTCQLRANLIFFGREHQYEATLETDALYRHVRNLVGDPLP
jgi:hypothetical protein